MYRQCSCLYRYSAYIFNIGAYSDPYSSIGATLLITLMSKTQQYIIVTYKTQRYIIVTSKTQQYIIVTYKT